MLNAVHISGAYSAPILASVFTGRDNVISVVLVVDGVVLSDLSALTRVVLDLDGTTTVDSDVAGSSVIWWTDEVSYRGALVDVLRLQLGDQSITEGSYPDASIIVYDATYPLGLRVENAIKVTVLA